MTNCTLHALRKHDISLKQEPYAGSVRLYYVNLGDYGRSHFTEQHKNAFVVANSIGEAKQRALATVSDWDLPHRDDMYEAEQAFALDGQFGDQRLHIHLAASVSESPLTFTCGYNPIGKKVRGMTP